MSEDYFDEDGDVIRTADNHVVWKNMQWAITEDGFLSAIWCGYHIHPDALMSGNHDWYSHMARKSWVDLAMFNEAFRVALRRSGKAFDETELLAAEARAAAYLVGRERTPRYLDKPIEHYGFWQ